MPVEVIADVRAHVGEAPAWDPLTGTLLFVDVEPGAVYRWTPDTGQTTRFHVGQQIGAALPRSDGNLTLACQDGMFVCGPDGEAVSLAAPVEIDVPANRMNEAKCDSRGRLWAGTMAYDFSDGAAALYRIDADGAVIKVLTRVTISNGLGWSPDDRRMYYIDSGCNRVDEFDFDADTGEIGRRRIFVTHTVGMADGLTVDADGRVWVAYFGASEVRCYEPDGSLADVIRLPVTQPTSCAFGGANLDELFITTGTFELTATELRSQPLAGATFRVYPGATGQPPAVHCPPSAASWQVRQT